MNRKLPLPWGLLKIFTFILFSTAAPSLSDRGSGALLSSLKKAAGVYKDRNLQVGLERTVFVTACNHGYLNHLHNFKCFCDRIGLKFLVIALDEKSYHYLLKDTEMHVYHMGHGSNKSTLAVEHNSTFFRSDQFNLITTRKKEIVHDIMLLGFDVLFADTDVAIIRDPMPFLLWSNVDYVHSVNTRCTKILTWNFWETEIDGNTGFYFVRSTPQTLKLWAKTIEAIPINPGLDDQIIFWRMIRQNKDPRVNPIGTCRNMDAVPSNSTEYDPDTPLTTCFLDICMFASGMLRYYEPLLRYEDLAEGLAFRNKTLVTLHANFIVGNSNKAAFMEHTGYWLKKGKLDDGLDTGCKPYESA